MLYTVIAFISCRNYRIKILQIHVLWVRNAHEHHDQNLVNATIIATCWCRFTIFTSDSLEVKRWIRLDESSYVYTLYIHVVINNFITNLWFKINSILILKVFIHYWIGGAGLILLSLSGKALQQESWCSSLISWICESPESYV